MQNIECIYNESVIKHFTSCKLWQCDDMRIEEPDSFDTRFGGRRSDGVYFFDENMSYTVSERDVRRNGRL